MRSIGVAGTAARGVQFTSRTPIEIYLLLIASLAIATVLALSSGSQDRAATSSLPQSLSVSQPADFEAPALHDATKQEIARGYSKLPLSFVKNEGQVDDSVRYYAQGAGFGFYFTEDRAVLALAKGERGQALHLRFVGTNPEAELVPTTLAAGKLNYLTSSRHQTNLPTYEGLAYRELWPGIDMVFSGAGGKLKYEFRLAAGADPNNIRLSYAGANGLSLGAGGALLIDTPGGTLRDARPHTFQQIDGRRVAVDSRYTLTGANGYGFAVGSYDHGRPLVIDPSLAYSSYLGGSNDERSRGIAVDGAGAAYLIGDTNSPDFQTTAGAFDTSPASSADAFVSKVNPTGSALAYSTYLGGSATEAGWGIAVDSLGAAYVTGETNSSNFPITAGAFDTTFNGAGSGTATDVFVTKLNPAGSALAYSTYFGAGGGLEGGRAITIDSLGAAYVTGITNSTTLFPTTVGAFDTTNNGGTDAFVTKFNPTGAALTYSTFLGGSAGSATGPIELARGIAVDSSGAAYVSGITGSTNFPTTAGAFNTSSNGGNDGFVTKLNTTGSALDYSTYFGGTLNDGPWGIAIDAAGAAYVAGATPSTNFPTTAGAFDTTFNGGTSDAFVTKFNAAGSALDYSTYLGGSSTEGALDGTENVGVAVHSGAAYVTAGTSSTNFPTTADAIDSTFNGVEDVFVTKLNAAGSALGFSTYLGGNDTDEGAGIAVDAAGDAYISGRTASTNFPTEGPFDPIARRFEAFPAKIAFEQDSADLSITKSDSPDPALVGDTITYTLNVANAGPSGASSVTVTDNLPAGTSFDSATASQGSCTESGGTVTCNLGSFASAGSATVTIDVTANTDGTLTDTASVSGAETDPDTANNTDSEQTTVNPSTDLSITKSDSPDPALVGDTITYTLNVANAGPSGASSVTVTDNLPAGTSFDSATASQGSCTESGGTVTCNLGSFASAGSATVTIDVTANTDGTLTDTASVSGAETDPDTANNTDSEQTTVNPSTDLSITKSDSPDPALVGDTITYTLNVANAGPSGASSVTVTDNLPAGTSFDSATASQGSCTESGGTVTCNLGSFASAGSATVTIDVTANTDGTLTDTASVSGAETDPDTANNTDSEQTTVEGPATVRLTPADAVNNVDTMHTVTATVKTASDRPFPGITVRFTVTGSINTTGSCTTNTNGQCSFAYQGPALPGADLIDAYADTNGNNTRNSGEPEAVPATKAWVMPPTAPGHVTGGGQVFNNTRNDKIAFGFNAKSKPDGSVLGECTVVDPSSDTQVKCLDATSVAISGTHATVFGNAEVNDTATTYRIDVDDLAEPGRNVDKFRILTASGYSIGGTIVHGNIQIHKSQ